LSTNPAIPASGAVAAPAASAAAAPAPPTGERPVYGPRVELCEVTKSFVDRGGERQVVFQPLTLDVEPGELVVVLGPSGSGKTTLLNVVAGVDHPDGGQVRVRGRAITAPGPERTLMFQEPALFPWLNVEENVAFGLRMQGMPKEERERRALMMLKLMRAQKVRQAFIHELSAGMRQRVALARALVLEPEVLLMDEPFSPLDAQTGDLLRAELVQLWQRRRPTILFVTHSAREAVLLGDRVVVLTARPAGVKRIFNVELSRPRDPNDKDVAILAAAISRELRAEIGKAMRLESQVDDDWTPPPSRVPARPDRNLGGGI
jgi:NitT/TauT family transport system ATP-binding protein